jgi:hypothetical protein
MFIDLKKRSTNEPRFFSIWLDVTRARNGCIDNPRDYLIDRLHYPIHHHSQIDETVFNPQTMAQIFETRNMDQHIYPDVF